MVTRWIPNPLIKVQVLILLPNKSSYRLVARTPDFPSDNTSSNLVRSTIIKIGLSSSGRTTAFEVVNPGSNPGSPSNLIL